VRFGLIGLSLGVAVAATGCVSLQNVGEAPVTPMRIVARDDVPEGPYQANAGDRVITQYLTPRILVELEADAVGFGPRAPRPVSQGSRLFGVVDDRGVTRYCAEPGARGASMAELSMTCFEDRDGDGSFEHGLIAASCDGPFKLAVRRWIGSFELTEPVPYHQADTASGPMAQVGLAYLGHSATGRYGFGLQVGGPDRWEDISATSSSAWLTRTEGALFEVAGANFEVIQRSASGAITYRITSGLDGIPVNLQVSTASRTLGELGIYSPHAG